MQLGVQLPTSGALAGPANIARIAREAEQLGYHSVWTYERLLRPMAEISMFGAPPARIPETYRLTYEPLETLSYVAALTDTVKLGTSVIDALLHPPIVLARRFATLDQLSGGRVIAGLGQGWMPQEFEAANVPMKRMGAGMDEVVEAMRACWGPDPTQYQGRFYRIEAAEVNPKPVQEPLPILFGSTTPAGIARAARIADGFNPIAFSAEQLPETVATFRRLAQEAGRDAAALSVVARANVPLTDDPISGNRPFLGGAPEQIAEDIARLESSGVDTVLIASIRQTDLNLELRLLDRLQSAVNKP
jgi:probable F420-dependent oxidoreductase